MTLRILVPVDLDDPESWKLTLPRAIREAEETGGRVTALTVVPDILAGLDWRYAIRGELGGSEEFDMHKLVAAAEKRLEEVVRPHVPAGLTVETIARHGTVYEEILDAAEELGIDQIVMTAQRPSVKDYLLGTNAAKVVRYAKCSVNIVRRS